MSIDPYCLCPGGTGKKVKFCCPDLLAEWEKIQRMLDGEQHLACLRTIEQLEKDRPDRACLLALKTSLLRITDQMEAAQSAAARFLEKHPGNPFALAETAILTAATRGGREAMPILQQAIAAEGDEFSVRCFDAIEATAHALMSQGLVLAARALFLLMVRINREEKAAVEMLLQINRLRALPLLVRDDRALVTGVGDSVPWKPAFDDALSSLAHARWAEGAERFAALAAQVPDATAVWWNLAILRGWLADVPGSIEALRRYASLDVPYENAVEAEALAMCLSEDPLGDLRTVCALTYTPDDTEQLQTALALSRRVVRTPIDPSRVAEDGGPPPKAAYLLLDRPLPASDEELTLENLPEVMAMALLYGRQTDREARLDVGEAFDDDLDRVQALLSEFVGQGLRPEPAREDEGRISASQELFRPRGWFPANTPPDRAQDLASRRRSERVLRQWPDVPLGILGGKSPRQASADPANSVRLSAAMMLLEHWAERTGEVPDLDPLRQQLGLPIPGPIDGGSSPVRSVPLVRLARVDPATLSDEDLIAALRRAMAFDVQPAINRFGRAVVDRPSLADRDEWLVACQMAARTDRDLDRALELVERGRNTSVDRGQSSASWDLLELSIRFARAEPDEAGRLLRHIEQDHIREPGVAETLTDILMEMGLILPDGSPAVPLGEPVGAGAAAQPAEPEPGKLWTPGSESPGGGKKLWVPGME